MTTDSAGRALAVAVCIYTRFDTHHETLCEPLPAWTNRLSHVPGVPISPVVTMLQEQWTR